MYLKNTSQMAVIARPKLNGSGEHWGVLRDGNVVHNTAERGIHVVTFGKFSAGKRVRIIRNISPEDQRSTLWRIQEELSRPQKYDLLNNNCETFANRVTGYLPKSLQVKKIIGGVATLGVFVWVISKAA